MRGGARVVGGAGGAHDLVNLVPIHIRLLSETLGHGDKRAGDGSTGGGVFAEQAELADRLLALHIPGKRLRIRLNQTRRHEMGTATLIEPLPRLPIDEVSAKRFAVTLNLRQIVRWFGHRLPGTHRTVANVIIYEVEGFVERVFQAGGGASGGEFFAQRAGLRACTHAASAPVGAIFDHGSPPRRTIVMISVLKSMGGVSG